MQELSLVHYWMMGVMLVMGIYGSIALFGYYRRLKKDKQS